MSDTEIRIYSLQFLREVGMPCHKGPQGRRTKVSQEAEGADGKHGYKLFLLYGRKLLGGDSLYLAGRETQMLGLVVRDL